MDHVPLEMGKHAHAAVTTGNEMIVAWGLLDARRQELRVLGRQAGASYPVVAVSGGAALIVASEPGERKLFTKTVVFSESQNAQKP